MESLPEARSHPLLKFIKKTEDSKGYIFILACGASREKQFDDVWQLSVNQEDFSVQYSKISYTNFDEKFTARNGQAGVFIPETEELLIFGGQDSVNNEQFNDLFCFNNKHEMKKIEFDLSEGMPYPRVRNSHTFVRDDQNKTIYCYGGANANDGPLNDLFEYNQNENEWVQLLTSGKDSADDVPPPLEMHTAHIYYDENLKPHMLLMGGRSIDELSSAIYCLNIEELTWSKIGDMPSIICSHATTLIKNKYVILYGGFSGTSIFDSIIRYDIKNNKWLTFMKTINYNSSEFFSDGRIASVMENANDEIIILFGGSSAIKDYNDVLCIKVDDLTNDDNFSEITQVL